MIRNKSIVFLIVTLVLTGLTMVNPQEVCAYGYQIKKSNETKIVWANKKINWHAGNKSFPAGSPYRNALVETNQIWNQAPSGFTFGIAKWGDSSLRRGNGQNEAWFSNDSGALKGAPAICYRWKYWSDNRLWWSEADIIFDADEPWSPYMNRNQLWPYSGPYRPFVTTALHEMGHALGLNHENRFYNIMGQDYTHVHTYQHKSAGYAGSDATQGAIFLYGKSPRYGWKEDLAVTHWKRIGTMGEYSKHGQTQVYYPGTTTSVIIESLDGMALNRVKPGSSYLMEFTYENPGYSNQSKVKTAWFISTNRAISTFDRMIGSTQIDLNAGTVWTASVQLTIPDDLTIGMVYYLGVIVDYQNNISEFDENNNSAYVQIKAVY